YGPFQLLDLPRGAAVEIRTADVERFAAGLLGKDRPAAPRSAPDQARARIKRTKPTGPRTAAAPSRPTGGPPRRGKRP
ncbi:MAG: hypothetical protein HOO94_03490, partial [Novosphingobium sp.]|nr:hypothetical protein [Novosphingobium sp.]